MKDKVIKGDHVTVDATTSLNNAVLGDHVKIAKYCSVFGAYEKPIIIGNRTYIGMMSILNGFNAELVIGNNVSIAQHVNIMTDSGPNASELMQKLFPLKKGPVSIGDHTWIGTNVTIMPNVTIGKCCVIAAHSFVNMSFPDYCIIGGAPAKIIRMFTETELIKIKENDKIS